MTTDHPALPVFRRALAWVSAHLDAFHPDHAFVSDHSLRVKPFIELVFVLNPFLRRGLHHQEPHLAALAAFCAQTFSTYDFAAFAHQDPAGLIVFALRDEFDALCGRAAARDGLLARYRQTGLPDLVRVSRTPYRAMDLAYSVARAELHFDPRSLLPDLPRTVLGTGRPLPHCTDSDLYSLTHTLFYLADLGEADLRACWSDTAGLGETLCGALGLTLRAGNADLSGELLMCLAFLGETDSPAARLAWERLAALQLPCGAVPAPSYRPGRDDAAPDSQAGHYRFTQSYHTTLVMLGAAMPALFPAAHNLPELPALGTKVPVAS
ncbi:hypothetical protein GO986_02510 [Deinococcus sp. HMF7620]|uniref:DUF6895 domain-containing protein n=1 Tax=Deinococcus arboris TaxID=2682977 RepID=A0A7C9HVZ1_9DEIO|nr:MULTISPECIES: hypothetical protein [Deinococcus]MBZ9751533.1 hypothetical protein [Deinococcus betulae]MVN85630.1 hypothetical protein [Deinococcus arboris]